MSLATPSVMFVCARNTDRSQMAMGWLRQLAGDRITVESSGPEPGRQLSHCAVAVMTEVGIDISHQHPRVLDPAYWFAAVARPIRDDIYVRVQSLVAELLPDADHSR